MENNTFDTQKKKTNPVDLFLITHLTRVPLVEKIFFLDHLRTMLGAGLSLVDGLHVLCKETQNKRLAMIANDVTDYVEKGNQLSEGLKKYPSVFPDMYVSMIASGELAGKLETAIEQVVSQMKKSYALTSSIRNAMIYPAVVVSAIVIIGLLMVTFVLPKITSLFDEFDAELPITTRVLIATTNFLSNPVNMVILLVLITGFFVTFITLLKKNLSFRRFVHRVVLHLPIVGPVSKKINLARFSTTLSSLLKSTIPIVEAVHISGQTCKNTLYRETIEKAKDALSKGEQLSDVLRTEPNLFPPMVTEMIMVGEKTGEIDHLLEELSIFYTEEVDKTMKNFATIIEPAVIVLLGLGVAGIALSIVTPMFSLIQNF